MSRAPAVMQPLSVGGDLLGLDTDRVFGAAEASQYPRPLGGGVDRGDLDGAVGGQRSPQDRLAATSPGVRSRAARARRPKLTVGIRVRPVSSTTVARG
ncbi:hypothetical protein [Nocardia callitridis]|uniref:hypothetical protein n=1 Tax=Nocardia callitridis TaxID=648753 RepID=UPI0031E8721B